MWKHPNRVDFHWSSPSHCRPPPPPRPRPLSSVPLRGRVLHHVQHNLPAPRLAALQKRVRLGGGGQRQGAGDARRAQPPLAQQRRDLAQLPAVGLRGGRGRGGRAAVQGLWETNSREACWLVGLQSAVRQRGLASLQLPPGASGPGRLPERTPVLAGPRELREQQQASKLCTACTPGPAPSKEKSAPRQSKRKLAWMSTMEWRGRSPSRPSAVLQRAEQVMDIFSWAIRSCGMGDWTDGPGSARPAVPLVWASRPCVYPA